VRLKASFSLKEQFGISSIGPKRHYIININVFLFPLIKMVVISFIKLK